MDNNTREKTTKITQATDLMAKGLAVLICVSMILGTAMLYSLASQQIQTVRFVFMALFIVSAACTVFLYYRLHKAEQDKREKEMSDMALVMQGMYNLSTKSQADNDKKIDQMKEEYAVPAEEIVNAIKALAKITIGRSKENADAMMNSNNVISSQINSIKEQLDTISGQPSGNVQKSALETASENEYSKKISNGIDDILHILDRLDKDIERLEQSQKELVEKPPVIIAGSVISGNGVPEPVYQKTENTAEEPHNTDIEPENLDIPSEENTTDESEEGDELADEGLELELPDDEETTDDTGLADDTELAEENQPESPDESEIDLSSDLDIQDSDTQSIEETEDDLPDLDIQSSDTEEEETENDLPDLDIQSSDTEEEETENDLPDLDIQSSDTEEETEDDLPDLDIQTDTDETEGEETQQDDLLGGDGLDLLGDGSDKTELSIDDEGTDDSTDEETSDTSDDEPVIDAPADVEEDILNSDGTEAEEDVTPDQVITEQPKPQEAADPAPATAPDPASAPDTDGNRMMTPEEIEALFSKVQ